MTDRLVLAETPELDRRPDRHRRQQGDDMPDLRASHLTSVATKELRGGEPSLLASPNQFGTRSQNRKPDIEVAARHIVLLPDAARNVPGNTNPKSTGRAAAPVLVASHDHLPEA